MEFSDNTCMMNEQDMTAQPEALRLADALDSAPYSSGCTNEAAAELRRLHAEIERLRGALREIADETYDSWTNGANAQRIAEWALKVGY
jgi:hypothetical protein